MEGRFILTKQKTQSMNKHIESKKNQIIFVIVTILIKTALSLVYGHQKDILHNIIPEFSKKGIKKLM